MSSNQETQMHCRLRPTPASAAVLQQRLLPQRARRRSVGAKSMKRLAGARNTALDPAEIDDLMIWGCVIQRGEQEHEPARG